MDSDDNDDATPLPRLPPRWVIRAAWKAHRGIYRVTRGRFGLRRARTDREGLAQLSVTGRRSGHQRSVMIAYYEDGADFVTMAMNGWDASEPAWWLNLQASPLATLELGDVTVDVVGRAAQGAEHDRLWERWRQLDVNVDRYASRRTDGTTVVILTPTAPQ